MEIEKTIQSLSNKIWYRFIKVLYILCFLFISSVALFFSYDVYKPKKIFDNEKSYIQCTATEGALYGLALNGVYLQSDYISSDNDKKFSQWCLNAIQEKSKINPADIVWDDEKQKPITRQRGNIDFREEPETISKTSGGRWQDAPIIPDTPYTLAEVDAELARRRESKSITRQRENGLPEGFEIETQPSAGLTDLQRSLQAGGKIVSVDHDPFAPPYKLVSHYKTEGTWNSFVIAGIVSIMTIFLIFETGRRIFYYVILGSLFPRKKA